MFYRSCPFILLLGLLISFSVSGCFRQERPLFARLTPAEYARATRGNVPAVAPRVHSEHPSAETIHFRNIADSAGLHYTWKITGKRPLNILQTIGNGCAFLDYDNDGNLDILLVGTPLALYKGNGHGHFTDVTHATGLDKISGHFLGCAVGDYDNDGYPDIYLSGYQTGILLHNSGSREAITFSDVTKAAGMQPQPWGTSCGFADLDGDGYLDLYVANYVEFGPKKQQLCYQQGVLTSCGPHSYSASHGVLYHNLGNGRFADQTAGWNVKHTGNGLGVAFADFDGSGRVGFAIANDELGGDLMQNVGAGQLKNINIESGTVGKDGAAHGGMGVDWGDVDNDGKMDFFVTTYQNEVKCLYHNEGSRLFSEISGASDLQAPTFPYVGFGCKFLDADNDGWLDLLIANGHVEDNITQINKAMSYRQPVQFFHNDGHAPFAFGNLTQSAGLGGLPRIVGRGLAVGDFDNDGRIDALVVDCEGKPLLLHNETRDAGHWIGFRLIGAGRSNRSAYGAVVTLKAGKQTLTRQCQTGGSYLSASDARVHFGLGDTKSLESVSIRWPDGKVEQKQNPGLDRYVTVVEGTK